MIRNMNYILRYDNEDITKILGDCLLIEDTNDYITIAICDYNNIHDDEITIKCDRITGNDNFINIYKINRFISKKGDLLINPYLELVKNPSCEKYETNLNSLITTKLHPIPISEICPKAVQL